MEKTRVNFIGEHMGESAPLTEQTLIETLDAVLFVDEAYSLCDLNDKGNVDMYGAEASAEIVGHLTRFKGMQCFIVGGYPRQMKKQFFGSNEGMKRRFPFRFLLRNLTPNALKNVALLQTLKHYGLYDHTKTPDELVAIADKTVTDDAKALLLKIFDHKTNEEVVDELRMPKTNEEVVDELRMPKVLKDLLENQAGSAANIGEALALHVSSERMANDSNAAFPDVIVSEDVEEVMKQTRQNMKLYRVDAASVRKVITEMVGQIIAVELEEDEPIYGSKEEDEVAAWLGKSVGDSEESAVAVLANIQPDVVDGPSAPPRRQTRAQGTVKLIQREAEWDPNIAMELNLDTELKEAYESAYAANDLGYFKNHTMNEFIHLVKLMYCTLKNSPVARQKFKETLSRISKKGHKNVMNGVYTWHQSFIAYDLPAAIGVKVKNTLI